jgi:hypothetical protein
MQYQVSRNGQMYGPYTLEDLQRYLSSGNILPTDLAKSEEMTEWLPVSTILNPPATGGGFSNTPAWSDPAQTTYMQATDAPIATPYTSPYPDAPNLNWGLVLLFSLLTCSLFMWIWNFIVAAWLKRVQPNATSLLFYAGAFILLILQLLFVPSSMHHNLSPGIHTGYSTLGSLIGLVAWVVKLIARFSQRASLEEHFNGPEPMGLQLNPVLVFFFGGIYFQYKLNEINAMKQAARDGAGRAR